MTRLVTTLLLAMVLSANARSAENDGPQARSRAMRQLAIRAAAQKVVDTLDSSASTLNEDAIRIHAAELSSRMMKRLTAHIDPDKSHALCKKILAARRRAALNRQIDETIARAREQTNLPLHREDVLALIGETWNRRVDRDASEFAARNINAVFAPARRQSVALQHEALKNRIALPEQTVLDKQLRALSKRSGHRPPAAADLEALTDALAASATPPDRPLFKEVEHTVRDAAQRTVARIKQQYTTQRDALRQACASLPDTALHVDTINQVLLEAIQAAIKAARVDDMRNPPRERSTIYEPFTVIVNHAHRMAVTLETQRLAAAMHRLEPLPLTPAAVEAAMRSNLDAHRTPKPSRQQLLRTYTAELQSWFSARLVELTGCPDDHAVTEHFLKLLNENQRLSTVFSNRVTKALADMLPAIRGRIKDDQLRAVFGAPPDQIKDLLPESIHAAWTQGRCAPAKTLDAAWQNLIDADIIADAPVFDTLIDESQAEIIATCNRLIPEACRAMREQANQLARLEQDWTPQLNRDVDKGRSVEEIASEWSHELNRRWQAYAARESLPYPDIFARTRDLLQKTVRKLFDSRQAEPQEETEAATESTPAAQKRPEEPPPEPPPEESTSITIDDMLETLDFVLFLRDINGASEAILMAGDGPSQHIAFEAGSVQSAVDAIYAAIIPAIEKAARSKAARRDQGPALLNFLQRFRALELKVAVLVGSEQVRHMTGILLRDRVQRFVEDWNATPDRPSLALEWEDNIEVAP